MKRVRTMDINGRPSDGDPYIRPGDVIRTSSGRQTTPFPKQKREVYRSRWLIENAVAEAESRGDEFNAIQFRCTPIFKHGVIVDGDLDAMRAYLFGTWQPWVPMDAIRPLEDRIGRRPHRYVEMTQMSLLDEVAA
ncbi:MAG: hypothetical protein ACLFVU_02040 [Phycisphaerae bacterium]